jgi:cell division septation protein DedD
MTIGGFMRLLRLVLLVGLAAAWMPGCSEKQKEADRLEQELLAQDSSSETLTSAAATADSVVTATPAQPPSPVADVSAVPSEDTPAVAPMPQAPAGFAYTVQVAACEDTVYARYLVKLYTARGYSPFVAAVNVGGQTFYRVRVGGYATVAEARQVQAELADKYSLGSWIDQ